jgi:3-oxoacyl-[acyl-carrier-protein] synthase III
MERRVGVLGTGFAVPRKAVESSFLDETLGLAAGTVERKTGVRRRYFAERDETAARLAADACRNALDAAQLTWRDVDCLIAASGTMDQGMPSNAALIHGELGLDRYAVQAFDVNASCLGFLTALDLLSWPIVQGRYRTVVIVSADLASCGLNWDDLGASGIFGDGAAAAVVGAGTNGSAILASNMRTLSEGVHFCEIPAGGSRYHPTRIDEPFDPLTLFRMDGKAVYRLVADVLPDFVGELLRDAGVGVERIACVVPHQASALAMEHMKRRLGGLADRFMTIFPEYGNQVAASMPTALHLAIASGAVARGDVVLLLGTGAGVSVGGMVLRY